MPPPHQAGTRGLRHADRLSCMPTSMAAHALNTSRALLLPGCSGMVWAHLLNHIEDIWLQLLCPVCSHPKVQLQVICVALEGFANTCVC